MMRSTGDIWAVVPIKETDSAKQRLAGILSGTFRQQLAFAMLEDVMRAVTAVSDLRGVIVVTLDRAAADLATQFGAEIWTEGARDGHTGAVTAAARRLAARGASMLTLPGDIPLATPGDVQTVLYSHGTNPTFTIVPALDYQGSNAILCTPADAVPLRFGPNSFYPHLDAARQNGVTPNIVRAPGIRLDIDEPADIAKFMQMPSATATWRFLSGLSTVGSVAMSGGQCP